jgi:hypothetical protein
VEGSGDHIGILSQYLPGETEETHENPVSIASDLAEIQTEHLSNVSLEH